MPRAGHTSFISETRLYVFGGTNQEGFCSSDLLIAELDQKVSKKIFRDESGMEILENNNNLF